MNSPPQSDISRLALAADPAQRGALVRGDTSAPLLNLTIGACLRRAARLWPKRDAAVFLEQGIRLSYAELADRAERFAHGLLQRNIARGDRVAIWAPNRAEWVIAQFGSAMVGAILVCINPAYRQEELRHALKLTDCAAIIAVPAFRGSDYVAMLRTVLHPISFDADGSVNSPGFPALRRLITIGDETFPGFEPFDSLLAEPPRSDRIEAIARDLTPQDAISIQFTSGTTGSPKGATLTHHGLVNNAYFCGLRQGLMLGDRLCLPVPLYHCFAMVLGSLAGVIHGATAVYPSAAFEPGATLHAIASERCTAAYGVPTMFVAMLAEPGFASHDLRSLRTGIMGGAPCPPEVMRRVIDEMNMREVTICYGMTETSPTSFQTLPQDPPALRIETVGSILPHLEACIRTPDGGLAAIGEPGEIAVRGPSVMRGYWRQPEATEQAIIDGWMLTGDLGTIDARGYLRIVGRAKDMIIRGGENVYPREVEDVLFAHPGIQEAYVFGIPDPRMGEEVCAWIRAADPAALSEDDVRGYCRDKLSRFKVPSHIRFVDAFPMTVTGKVQKFAMRDQMTAILKSADS